MQTYGDNRKINNHMKRIFIFITIIITTYSCAQSYNKGKKGDFSYRKCSDCHLKKINEYSN